MANKEDKIEIDEKAIDTVLAADIEFKGTLRFKKSLMIKGKFEGEIDADGHLIVGPDAEIRAKVRAGVLTAFGKIHGNVETRERLELYRRSELTGDAKTPEIMIEKGARFNGACHMGGDKPAEKKPETKA